MEWRKFNMKQKANDYIQYTDLLDMTAASHMSQFSSAVQLVQTEIL